jgi:hypothetical protein
MATAGAKSPLFMALILSFGRRGNKLYTVPILCVYVVAHIYKGRESCHHPGVRSLSWLSGAAACVLAANPCFSNDLPEPASWIPPTANFIAYVDVATLLSSPSLKGLDSVLARQISSQEIESFRELTGMDPWRDFHVLCFFSEKVPEGSEGDAKKELWGVAVSGAFDVKRVLESMDERVRLKSRKYGETEIHELLEGTGWTGASDGGPQAIAFPDGSTALFGPLGSVERMLDAGFGLESSSADRLLASGLDQVFAGDALWVVSAGPAGFEKGLRGSLAGKSELPSLSSFGLSVRTGVNLRFRGWAEAKSSESASHLADLLRGVLALRALSGSSESAMPALESVEVEAVGERLEASFEIDGREARKWLLQRAPEARDRNTK